MTLVNLNCFLSKPMNLIVTPVRIESRFPILVLGWSLPTYRYEYRIRTSSKTLNRLLKLDKLLFKNNSRYYVINRNVGDPIMTEDELRFTLAKDKLTIEYMEFSFPEGLRPTLSLSVLYSKFDDNFLNKFINMINTNAASQVVYHMSDDTCGVKMDFYLDPLAGRVLKLHIGDILAHHTSDCIVSSQHEIAVDITKTKNFWFLPINIKSYAESIFSGYLELRKSVTYNIELNMYSHDSENYTSFEELFINNIDKFMPHTQRKSAKELVHMCASLLHQHNELAS